MKMRLAEAVLAALTVLLLIPQCSQGQGTAFAYQGQLNAGGAPANGAYDFRFKLCLDALGANPVGSPFLTNDIGVSNGMFNVAVDFGADVFNGSNYWLEIDVRTNGATTYVALSPLQPILPAPYAIFANTASNLSGTVSAGQLTGSVANSALPGSPSFSGTVKADAFAGNGAAVTNLNPANIAPGTAAINISGNAATATTAATANSATTASSATTALSANTAGALSGTLPTAQLSGTLANSLLPASPTFAGTVTAGSFAGNGAAVTNLNPANLSSGTAGINISGNAATATTANTATTATSATTAISANTAAALTGTLPASQLSGALDNSLLPASPIFSGTVTAASYIGNGATLTNLDPTKLSSGTAAISITGHAASAGSAVTANVAAALSGTLPAAQLTGTLANSALPANPTFSGAVTASAYVGNGAGLTNITSTELAPGQSGNMFVGPAGNPSATGGFNTALGYQAFVKNTSGSANAALGNSALAANTTGAGNTAAGYAALYENSSGGDNVALGQGALEVNTVGSGNVAVGVYSLHLSQNGNNNTGLGYYTFSSFGNVGSGGASNIAIGYLAGEHLGGSENYDIDIGNPGVQGESGVIRLGSAGIHTNTVIAGVIIGNGAGLTNLSLPVQPNGNFFVGSAGNASATGAFNLGVGGSALAKDTTGSINIALGGEALANNTSGRNNLAAGYAALQNNSAGYQNVALGGDALEENTTGGDNVALGAFAVEWNQTGSDNVGIGFEALSDFGADGSGGTNNIAIGELAGVELNGDENNDIYIANVGAEEENNTIRIGTSGLHTNTFIAGVINGNGAGLTNLSLAQLNFGGAPVFSADDYGNFSGGSGTSFTSFRSYANTGLGDDALEKDTGGYNSGVGYAALSENTSGEENTAIGCSALVGNTTASGNTGVGYGALAYSQLGATNTAVGMEALEWLGFNTGNGGSNNIAIGAQAGSNFRDNESDNIEIGNTGEAGDYGTMRLGAAGIQTNAIIAGVIHGDGAGLTNLSAASLVAGAISTNALPGFQGPNFQTIGGGSGNTNDGYIGTIAGGQDNAIYAVQAPTGVVYQGTIGGGYGNIVSNSYATIAGGIVNVASGSRSVVGGGQDNTASGEGAVIAGGGYDGTYVLGNVASGSASFIGGGEGNSAGDYAAVGGGNQNCATGAGSFIGGGGYDGATFYVSYATGAASVIGGGLQNTNTGRTATIAGGANNLAKGWNTFVGGGYNNHATGNNSTIGGGSNNVAGGPWSSVGGGLNNQATNNNACVPGGANNVAGGLSCFAAGLNAQAVNDHSFVWSDGSATTTSTANDQFMLRASGGAIIYSSSGNSSGVSLGAGSGTWSSLSDRNAKEHINPVAPQDALAKVVAMPVSQWSYKTEHGVKHIGPMAQDFYAAFNLGPDDKHITTIDESGVALAAIQGLNQKVDQRDAEIQTLKEQNQMLQQRLDRLQQSVDALANKQ